MYALEGRCRYWRSQERNRKSGNRTSKVVAPAAARLAEIVDVFLRTVSLGGAGQRHDVVPDASLATGASDGFSSLVLFHVGGNQKMLDDVALVALVGGHVDVQIAVVVARGNSLSIGVGIRGAKSQRGGGG